MLNPDAKAILVLEDDVNDTKLLGAAFEQIGVLNPIRFLTTAMDAIAYLRGSVPYVDRDRYPLPSVIILDIKLPGIDGFEFLVWLKERQEFDDTLVVVVSGLEDLRSIRRAYTLGADSFLTKPCRVPDLENLMQWFPGYWLRPVTTFTH